MQIVIDIPESTYKVFKNLSKIIGVLVYEKDILMLIKAVKNGTPLPKGHGRLIDVDALPQEDKDITVKSILKPGTIACVGAITLQEYINSLPTIIEAESEAE